MTDTITLVNLRTKARERADMVSSLFVTDSELNGYIQESYKELYDLLVDAVEDYNLTSLSDSTTTITTGNTFNLPTDHYKLRGVDDLTDAQNPRTVRKFNFGERNDYLFSERLSLGAEFSDVLYRVAGSKIYILPPDKAARVYRIWYVPLPTVPTSDSDTIDAINGWAEYVIIDAAIKCRIKEESDVRELRNSKKDVYERITRMKNNRDQNIPDKVTRIRNRRRTGFYSYLGDTQL